METRQAVRSEVIAMFAPCQQKIYKHLIPLTEINNLTYNCIHYNINSATKESVITVQGIVNNTQQPRYNAAFGVHFMAQRYK